MDRVSPTTTRAMLKSTDQIRLIKVTIDNPQQQKLNTYRNNSEEMKSIDQKNSTWGE